MNIPLDNAHVAETLGDRMKQYESEALSLDSCSDRYVVLRLDGCHFHTWVKKAHLRKPFDERMVRAMQNTTLALCEEINTCIMGYCQSDEIMLVLKRGENPGSEPWFGNRIQKLCSISASICSVAFNDAIGEYVDSVELERAYFDSRVMFLPSLDECVNCLIWRQNDCIKNSISSLAQSMFSPKELNGKRGDEQIAMMLQKETDWNALPTVLRMGTLVHKRRTKGTYNGMEYFRGVFFMDGDIPRFSQNRQFLLDAYNFDVEA